MSANGWTSKQVEKLIECVKSRTHIYDPKHINNKNQCKRRNSFAEIAKELHEIRYTKIFGIKLHPKLHSLKFEPNY
jgi:hypothetical protein